MLVSYGALNIILIRGRHKAQSQRMRQDDGSGRGGWGPRTTEFGGPLKGGRSKGTDSPLVSLKKHLDFSRTTHFGLLASRMARE